MADTEGEGDRSLAVKTVTKLLLSAEHYASVSPALARFHMLEAERIKQRLSLPASSASQICPYCYVIRRPDNCTRRLMPRIKTRQVQRLVRKNADGRTFGKLAKSLLDLHIASTNRLQIRCRSCGKRALVRGVSRPSKSPRALDLCTSRDNEGPARKNKKKKKKRTKKPTADSSTKAPEVLFVGKEMKQKGLEKCEKPMSLSSDYHPAEKQRVTNKKTTQKQKHNMLQRILKQKTNTASADTSAGLRSFLMSL